MGLVGAPAVLGVESSMFRCFVQIPGEALRLDTDQLWRFLQAYPIFRQLLFNYVQALMTLQGQNIVCGIRHNVHQRVARWLLMALDRMDGTEIPATHDLMARMLGARRASVTQAIGDLEAAQAIAHARGQLTVVDRPKLESLACECYGLVRLEYDRLLRPESISRAFPKTKLEAFAAAFKLGRE
jgi:CRP-like cAMP-binding protein